MPKNNAANQMMELVDGVPTYGRHQPYPAKELQLQMAVANALAYTPGIVWCHVPNEQSENMHLSNPLTARQKAEQRGKKQRHLSNLKKAGLNPGVPDCLIFNPNGHYIGLAVELKAKRNKPTDNQKTWLKSLLSIGWYACVCYNVESFDYVLKHYRAGLQF